MIVRHINLELVKDRETKGVPLADRVCRQPSGLLYETGCWFDSANFPLLIIPPLSYSELLCVEAKGRIKSFKDREIVDGEPKRFANRILRLLSEFLD